MVIKMKLYNYDLEFHESGKSPGEDKEKVVMSVQATSAHAAHEFGLDYEALLRHAGCSSMVWKLHSSDLSIPEDFYKDHLSRAKAKPFSLYNIPVADGSLDGSVTVSHLLWEFERFVKENEQFISGGKFAFSTHMEGLHVMFHGDGSRNPHLTAGWLEPHIDKALGCTLHDQSYAIPVREELGCMATLSQVVALISHVSQAEGTFGFEMAIDENAGTVILRPAFESGDPDALFD
jgi:hypothetical protein